MNRTEKLGGPSAAVLEGFAQRPLSARASPELKHSVDSALQAAISLSRTFYNGTFAQGTSPCKFIFFKPCWEALDTGIFKCSCVLHMHVCLWASVTYMCTCMQCVHILCTCVQCMSIQYACSICVQMHSVHVVYMCAHVLCYICVYVCCLVSVCACVW